MALRPRSTPASTRPSPRRGGTTVTAAVADPDIASRRSRAMRRAIGNYVGQLRIDWRVSVPALVLPGIGAVLTNYLPPLIVSRILVEFAGVSGGELALGDFVPYIVLFAAAWLSGEVMWRVGIHFLNRADARGVERLYLSGMDALLAKDL